MKIINMIKKWWNGETSYPVEWIGGSSIMDRKVDRRPSSNLAHAIFDEIFKFFKTLRRYWYLFFGIISLIAMLAAIFPQGRFFLFGNDSAKESSSQHHTNNKPDSPKE